jgi:glycosyltransferase involved in cell wall biosynthesis
MNSESNSASAYRICVLIPAFNESQSIGKVIAAIPPGLVSEVVVVNNASTDDTSAVACAAGATVVDQPERGYGNACLKGMEYLQSLSAERQPDILVFLDGDFSDFPAEMIQLVAPIGEAGCDLVIGSRVLGKREKGSLTPQQRVGNWIATRMLRIFYRVKFTDLGPFRAIRWKKLLALNMKDKTYGWTVEMQVKAAKKKYKCVEIPVSYRKRIGQSKISGTISGSIKAGIKIIATIFRYL